MGCCLFLLGCFVLKNDVQVCRAAIPTMKEAMNELVAEANPGEQCLNC